MAFFDRIKPKFWDHTDVAAGPYKHLFNFRRIWQLVVFLMVVVTLAPLITIALLDYSATQESMKAGVLHRTSRFVANTWRTVSFFCPSGSPPSTSSCATTPSRSCGTRRSSRTSSTTSSA